MVDSLEIFNIATHY